MTSVSERLAAAAYEGGHTIAAEYYAAKARTERAAEVLLGLEALPEYICPACGVADPDVVTLDFGIGAYEYWGATGYHTDEHTVTKCCEAQPELFAVEPEPAIYEYEVCSPENYFLRTLPTFTESR